MGYQSYGNFDKKIYSLLKDGVTKKGIKDLPIDYDAAHTAQIYFEEEYAKLVRRFEHDNMIFSGGTALNVINKWNVNEVLNAYAESPKTGLETTLNNKTLLEWGKIFLK